MFSRHCLCRRTIESLCWHTEGVPTFPDRRWRRNLIPSWQKEPHPPSWKIGKDSLSCSFRSTPVPLPRETGKVGLLRKRKIGFLCFLTIACVGARLKVFCPHTEGVPTFPACGEGGPYADGTNKKGEYTYLRRRGMRFLFPLQRSPHGT